MLGGGSIFWIGLLLEFLLGLEGNSLRRWELARRGFRLADIAAGLRRTDAERSYFGRALRRFRRRCRRRRSAMRHRLRAATVS